MTNSERIERARGWDRDAAVDVWNRIVADDPPPEWAPGIAFEYLVIRAFELEEVEVTWPFSVSLAGQSETLEQIDGAVHVTGLSCLVESKSLSKGTKVNVGPIAKMRNQLLRRPAATVGMIFSRSGYTDAALTLAQFTAPQTILLWERDQFDWGLRHGELVPGLRSKLRHAAEYAVPDYNPYPTQELSPENSA